MTAKMIYGALGWCAVALAIAGVLLPGLPTTVFVLAASYCFSRSSPRFERWLRENRWLGPVLRRFGSASGMPRHAKRAALTAMWLGILLSSLLLVRSHLVVAFVTVGLGIAGTLSILFAVRTLPDGSETSLSNPQSAISNQQFLKGAL